jgi:hypothetical protein
MHGGRTMGKYSEVFVAFDVAKKKHAVIGLSLRFGSAAVLVCSIGLRCTT